MSGLNSPFVTCPNCDSTEKAVKPIGGAWYECTCCSKTFEVTSERSSNDDARPPIQAPTFWIPGTR